MHWLLFVEFPAGLIVKTILTATLTFSDPKLVIVNAVGAF